MDAYDGNEIPTNGGGISSAGRNATHPKAAHPNSAAHANAIDCTVTDCSHCGSKTTSRQRMSTGGSKSKKKPTDKSKRSKPFNLRNILSRLNDYNLFPGRIKAISGGDDPNVNNRKSPAHSNVPAHHRSGNWSGGSKTDNSTNSNPISDSVSDVMIESKEDSKRDSKRDSKSESKRNSIRKSISNSIRNSIRYPRSSKRNLVKNSATNSKLEATNQTNPADHSHRLLPLDNDCSPNSSANRLQNAFDNRDDNSFDNSFHESSNQSPPAANAPDPSLRHLPSYRKSPLLRLLAAVGLPPGSATYSTPLNRLIFLSAILFILLLSLLTDFVYCDHINLPPRFVTLAGYPSDIVLTIKEGNSSLNKEIYRLAGEDPNDGDRLRFGVIGPIGNDILRIENDVPTLNQATIYLKKELDRETQPSYSLVLTLTDGKLAKGSYVSKKKREEERFAASF